MREKFYQKQRKNFFPQYNEKVDSKRSRRKLQPEQKSRKKKKRKINFPFPRQQEGKIRSAIEQLLFSFSQK